MCFKLLSVTLVLPLVILSCARSDEPSNQPIVPRLNASADCIGNMGARVDAYINAKLSAKDTAAFWNCLSDAVREFEVMTAGEGEADYYTGEALRQFLNHYFLTDKPLPKEFVKAVMDVKRVLLGGDAKVATRAELAELRTFLMEMKAITLDLLPHIPVVFRMRTNIADGDIRAASEVLNRSFARLGAWLQRHSQDYTFSSLNYLVVEFEKYMRKGTQPSPGFKNVLKALAFLPEAKPVFLGGKKEKIEGSEWLAMTYAVARGAYLYMAVINATDSNLDAALLHSTLPEAASGVMSALLQSVSTHPKQQIPLSEWKDLFKGVEKAEWLPKEFTATAFQALLEWLLVRPLNDGTGKQTGMRKAHVEVFDRQLKDWSRLLAADQKDTDPLVVRFNQMLAASEPISWDDQGRMEFRPRSPFDWSSTARMRLGWNYVVLHWLKDAYAGTSVEFLTMEQMETAAHEILPLLKNFGWLLQTQETIGKRLLREADLFTHASNGNGVLDVSEGVRYLAFVVSSYRTAQIWLERADLKCGTRKADCVRALAKEPMSEVISAMPRLRQTILNWNPDRFDTCFRNAERVSLGDVVSDEFTVADLLQTYQLLGYVEVFIHLYDHNSSEAIDLPEAFAALKVYGPTLARMLGFETGDDPTVRAFFTFMMKYGDTPFTMFGGQIMFNFWRWHEDSWTLEAERDTLMAILTQLSKF